MRVGGWVVSRPAACVNLYGWVRRLCSSLVSYFGDKTHHPESPGGRSSQIEFRGLPVARISHTGALSSWAWPPDWLGRQTRMRANFSGTLDLPVWRANSGLLHCVVEVSFVIYVGAAEFLMGCMKKILGKLEFFSRIPKAISLAFWTIFAAANLCIELGPPYFEIMGGHMWTSRGPACGVKGCCMNLSCTFLFSMTFMKVEVEDIETFCMRTSGRPAFSWARLSCSGWWMTMASTEPCI